MYIPCAVTDVEGGMCSSAPQKRPYSELGDASGGSCAPAGLLLIDAESKPKSASSYLCRRSCNTKRAVDYARALFAGTSALFLTKIGNTYLPALAGARQGVGGLRRVSKTRKIIPEILCLTDL